MPRLDAIEPPSPGLLMVNVGAPALATVRRRFGAPVARALPLASHWTAGDHKLSEDWGLHTQLELIQEGHYLLPWLSHPRKERPELQAQIEKHVLTFHYSLKSQL